jgi:hypothetical protein
VCNFAHCLTVRVDLQMFRIYCKHPKPLLMKFIVEAARSRNVIDTLSSRYLGLHHRFLSVTVDQVPILDFGT